MPNYATLRDRKTGALIDARCEAELKARPYGGLDKVTWKFAAAENMTEAEVRKALGRWTVQDEFGVAAEGAFVALAEGVKALGHTDAQVKALITNKTPLPTSPTAIGKELADG